MKITIQEFHNNERNVKIGISEQFIQSDVPVSFLKMLLGRDDIIEGDVFELDPNIIVRTRKPLDQINQA
jgi:hypothetical protein